MVTIVQRYVPVPEHESPLMLSRCAETRENLAWVPKGKIVTLPRGLTMIDMSSRDQSVVSCLGSRPEDGAASATGAPVPPPGAQLPPVRPMLPGQPLRQP
jgi:hypothetical protein